MPYLREFFIEHLLYDVFCLNYCVCIVCLCPQASKEIAAEAERLDMKSKAPLILVELLCDQNMKEQLKTYRNHFLRVGLSSLFSRYYAEACNEWRGLCSRLVAWTTQLPRIVTVMAILRRI